MEGLLQQLENENTTNYNPRQAGFSSLYYQPERILISSDQAEDTNSGAYYFDTEFFDRFQVKLPRPALNVKSIQLVRASIPNICPNIPDTATTFWYYRIPTAVVDAYGDVLQPQYLKFVRLLPSWYKPELNPNSSLYGFNRAFYDYQDLESELAKSCANDPLDGYFKSTAQYQNSLQAKTVAQQNYDAAVVYRNQQQQILNQAQAAYNAAVAAQAAAQATYDQALIDEAAALAYLNANPFDPFALQNYLDALNARIQAEINLTNANIQLGFTQSQLSIAQQDFNTAQAAETQTFLILAQAVGDFNALVNSQGFIPEDILITYNQATQKFEYEGLNAFDDQGDRQFYYIYAGYTDPNLWEDNNFGAIELTNQSALYDDFGLAVPPQQYKIGQTLNLRLGFTWNGVNRRLVAVNPQGNAPLGFRFRPIPDILDANLQVQPLKWDEDATIYTAESYANLVNTTCVNVYLDSITGATATTLNDDQTNLRLLAAVPMNASSLGVSFYNLQISNPLTKIISSFYDFTIILRTDTGEPFYLPNSAIVSLELALTY